jgi:dimethylamine/trimethylamine dehydrogenase
VTARKPNDALYHEILATVGGDESRLPFTLSRIGDCEAPAIVAAAVYSGRRYAEEMDAPIDPDLPLKHDRPVVAGDFPRSEPPRERFEGAALRQPEHGNAR